MQQRDNSIVNQFNSGEDILGASVPPMTAEYLNSVVAEDFTLTYPAYLSNFTWDDFFRNTSMRYTLGEQSGHCDVPMGQNPSQPNARSLHSPVQRMDEQRRHDAQYGT